LIFFDPLTLCDGKTLNPELLSGHGAVERNWINGDFDLSLVTTINQAGGRLPKVEAAKSWEEYFTRIEGR
jgi:hypothetical protein